MQVARSGSKNILSAAQWKRFRTLFTWCNSISEDKMSWIWNRMKGQKISMRYSVWKYKEIENNINIDNHTWLNLNLVHIILIEQISYHLCWNQQTGSQFWKWVTKISTANWILTDKRVFEESWNTFKTAVNVVKQASGFLKDCQGFIFQRNRCSALWLEWWYKRGTNWGYALLYNAELYIRKLLKERLGCGTSCNTNKVRCWIATTTHFILKFSNETEQQERTDLKH